MAETKKSPTIEEVKVRISDTADQAGEATADTTATQGKVDAVASKLEGRSGSISFKEAAEVQAMSDQLNSPDALRREAAMNRLDEMQSKYGPTFLDDSRNLLYKASVGAKEFRNKLTYGMSSQVRDAAVLNDPTYTSPEQAMLSDISAQTEDKAKKMYKDRQGELAAQAPVYAPLSNDPSTNQMLLGIGMQAASGLLAMIDPEAAAAAAAEIGMKTIDTMYDRKLRIDATNKELYGKYLEAYGKHTARSDKVWETYFNAVMDERKDLKNTMQKQISDEYQNLIDKNKSQIEAMKQSIDAMEKSGKLAQGDAEAKRKALETKGNLYVDLLKAMQDEKDAAKRLGFLYHNAAQQRINKWFEPLAPAVVSKDPEVNGLMGANSDAGEMLTWNNIEDVREGMTGMDDAKSDPEFSSFNTTMDANIASLATDDDDFEAKATELINNIVDYKNNIVLPDDIKAQGRKMQVGYRTYVKGQLMKKVETIVNMKRSKQTGEQAIELAAVKGAIAGETAMKKLEAREIPEAKKAILAGKTAKQIKAKLIQYVGEEIANRDDLTLDEKLKLAGD